MAQITNISKILIKVNVSFNANLTITYTVFYPIKKIKKGVLFLKDTLNLLH
jgi:hypothetical protein